jgi:hypothetical protein
MKAFLPKVKCLMEKVLMGFDERNALNTIFLKAIFSVTELVSMNESLYD